MNTEVLNLLILQFSTVGDGYVFAELSQKYKAEILELSYLGMGTLVILETGSSSANLMLENLRNDNPSLVADAKFVSALNKVPYSLFQKYLSLSSGRMLDNLSIFETEFIGDMLEFALTLSAENILDLRLLRGTHARTVMFVSHSRDLDASVVPLIIRPTYISKVSPAIRAYFDFSVEGN